MTLDFAMLPDAAPKSHGHRDDVVAVHVGHRVACARVYWRSSGEVFISVEGDAGLGHDAARGLIASALRDALREIPYLPEHPERPAQGPQFCAGRMFARALARALKAGNASIINP